MKIREILKAVFLVAGIIMLTAACKKDEGPTLDFNITVPSDWRYYILTQDNTVYYAQSPQKTTTDSVSEDLVITKNPPKDFGLSNGMTLNSFYTAYVIALQKDTTVHPISSIDTTINGEEAIKLTHLQTIYAVNTSTSDTIHLDAKIQKYFLLNNDNGYVLSFNALTSTFDEYHAIFDNIISTFNFKK